MASQSSCTIIQWNCRSMKRKLAELQHRVEEVDLLLIQETWLKPGDNISLRGFDIVRTDRLNDGKGGVAIFVENSIKYRIKNNIYNCGGKIEVCGI